MNNKLVKKLTYIRCDYKPFIKRKVIDQFKFKRTVTTEDSRIDFLLFMKHLEIPKAKRIRIEYLNLLEIKLGNSILY